MGFPMIYILSNIHDGFNLCCGFDYKRKERYSLYLEPETSAAQLAYVSKAIVSEKHVSGRPSYMIE